MAMMMAQIPTWEVIDLAESYLVCCMFDEAASLSSTVLKQLLANTNHRRKNIDLSENCYEDNEFDDMLESAGMVFVQSFKQLQRTSDILKDLKLLFGSVSAVPIQVFITGVCFQMNESPTTNVQGFLEEFLNNWIYEDGQYYSLSDAEVNTEGSFSRVYIDIDKYLEVVELYMIRFLVLTLKDTDRAIAWVNKAMLPIEKRQELLRRLNSMSHMVNNSSHNTISPELPNEYTTKSDLLQERRDQKEFESRYVVGGENTAKEEILKLARQRLSSLWWFPSINLKLGSTQLVVPSGKLLLASLLLLMYYFTRKRHAAVKRVIVEKALSVKDALLDLWQLAFSYQVNPLAAVQPLPTVMHGSR